NHFKNNDKYYTSVAHAEGGVKGLYPTRNFLRSLGYIIISLIVKCVVLDSERSDECSDFTMLCFFFFFVSVYTRKCRNNASISNYGGGFL
ncbi:Uncharacterized protein FWK35_00026969, partial [Aphis craccivora]